MTRKNSEAVKAWENTIYKGETNWLKDTTFVSADFFQPPSSILPHAWERIAVPPATSSHGRGKLFKRVPGQSVDTKYNTVVAELESQGFGGRKRVKMSSHKRVWGLSKFDIAYETEKTDNYDIGRARYQVKRAYKQIAEDNENILKNARPSKRPSFDPSELKWTPRKRHNTRWPVNPPTWEAMIGECQPLTIFELDVDQIDDIAFWEQENQIDQPQQEQDEQLNKQHDDHQRSKKRSRRRRSVVQRPSLSTISEEHKEPSGVPALTPGTKYRPMYTAPANRWSAAAEKYYASQKVASSPLKKFTMAATPNGVTTGDAEEDEETNESSVIEITNERGHFRCPSSPLSSRSATTTASNRKRKAQNEIISQRSPIRRRSSNTMAIFDQPTPEVHTEPEHETKRRVSLDNARRSDRQSEMTNFKKVRSWVASTFTGRRRSFAETVEEQEDQDEQPRRKRRHTLDVDVGRNPDIFGQMASQQRETTPEVDIMPSTTPEVVLPRAVSPTPTPQGGAAELKRSTPIATNEPIPQKATQAVDAQPPSIENGITSVGSGATKNVEATLSAQEDSISEAESESSATPNEVNPEAEAPLEDTATPAYHKRVVIDWGAITNIDDKIRDLLDRKAAIVYNEPMHVTKEDAEDTTVSEEDETQPFEASVLDRIMNVLASDEDEDTTMEIPEVDSLAAGVSIADPPPADTLMADTPVADASALDSPVRVSPLPDLLTAVETSAETAASNIVTVDIVVSEEATVMSQSVEASEYQSGATTSIEPTVMLDTPILDEPTAISQSAEAPEQDSYTAVPNGLIPFVSTSEKPAARSQSVEATECSDAAALAPDEPEARSQAVEAPKGDSNDEEYAMLHSFVRRAQMKPKRKESTTSSTGSPKAQVETSTAVNSPRQPLGQKDANRSPSPTKKRKLKEAEGAPLDMTKTSRLVKPDLDDTTPQPLRKRRRKGAETDSPDEIFNPDMAMSQSLTQRGSSGGPRRSKRVATTKTTEPFTPSHIPVRLPGSFDADMPAVSTAGLMQRKTEKDLTTLTRTNTRRNKGAALPVPARLAGLSLPTDTASAADPFTSPSKPAVPKAAGRGKAVRWDETLARFQGDSRAPGAAAVAEEPATSVPAPAPAPVPAEPEPVDPAPMEPLPVVEPVPVESEKKKALRPRPSRLPAAVSAAKKTKTATTAPAPSRVTPAKRSGALGARLGTPAPKRRKCRYGPGPPGPAQEEDDDDNDDDDDDDDDGDDHFTAGHEVGANINESLCPALGRCHALVVVVVVVALAAVSSRSVPVRARRSTTSRSTTSGVRSAGVVVVSPFLALASRRGPGGGPSRGPVRVGPTGGVGASLLALALALGSFSLARAGIGIARVGVGVARVGGTGGGRLGLLGDLLVGVLRDGLVRVQNGLRDIRALLGHGGGLLISLDGGGEVLLVLGDLGHDALQGLGGGDLGRGVVGRQRGGVGLLDRDAAAKVLGVLAADGAH
ncbi:hypothetical protein diail_2475, partial [Diaporthe ilicicola]